MLQLNESNAADHVRSAVLQLPQAPHNLQGRGVVICGGGVRYFLCAWVCINMLRKQGCQLPIELWYLNSTEMSDRMRNLVAPLGVACINAEEVRRSHPVRILNGWELKPFALLHSAFREVLLLDADNVPVVDPTFLFESKQYEQTGSIFWPDIGRLAPSRSIWSLTGVTYRDEPEFESGQIVLDKARCFEPLSLTMWFNEYSDFWYQHIHGDKETFHIAWRRLDAPYSMPAIGVHTLPHTMCQHDFDGHRIFQHRSMAKWSLYGNLQIPGFVQEPDCLGFIAQLAPYWTEIAPVHRYSPAGKEPDEVQAAVELISQRWIYERVGHDRRPMIFRADGTVGEGSMRMEVFWDIRRDGTVLSLSIQSEEALTCRLIRTSANLWQGRWESFERMPVRLIPADQPAALLSDPARHILQMILEQMPESKQRFPMAESRSEYITEAITQLTGSRHRYCRVGYDSRFMMFNPDGSIGEGRDRMEQRWKLYELDSKLLLEICSASGVTCRLEFVNDGVWRGRWDSFEQMPIIVYPEP